MSHHAATSESIALASIGDVDRLVGSLSLFSRPRRLRISTSLLSPIRRRRLENDLSACGCGAGSGAALIALLALVVFARGVLTWELALGWFLTLAVATLAGKVSALLITYARARFTLHHVRTSLMQSREVVA